MSHDHTARTFSRRSILNRQILLPLLLGLVLVVPSSASGCLHSGLGRFCQRDPLDYVEGSSLYLPEHGNPNESTDPTGLYDPNFHYDTILFLHRARCWDEAAARTVAYWSQEVDDNPSTNPMHLGLLGFFEHVALLLPTPELDRLASYHFPGSGWWVDTVEDEPRSRARVQRAYVAFENGNNGDFRDLGRWLHTYADSYAHAGYSAYPRYVIDVGHALDGHAPDRTSRDVPKALRAAAAIWNMIPDRCCRGPRQLNPEPNSDWVINELTAAFSADRGPVWR